MQVSQQSRLSRSRSRSRSRARPIARSRSVPAMSMVPRSVRYNGVNHITRTCQIPIYYTHSTLTNGYGVANSTGVKAFGIAFSPSNVFFHADTGADAQVAVLNYTDVSNLYDRVRIDRIKLSFMVNQHPSGVDPGLTDTVRHSLPILWVANDEADITTLGEANMAGEGDLKVLTFESGGPRHHWVKPMFQTELYKTATSVGYKPTRGFINSSDSVPHRGVKVWCQNYGNVGTHVLQLTVKYYLTVSNVH